jgi:hypothetical protein
LLVLVLEGRLSVGVNGAVGAAGVAVVRADTVGAAAISDIGDIICSASLRYVSALFVNTNFPIISSFEHSPLLTARLQRAVGVRK